MDGWIPRFFFFILMRLLRRVVIRLHPPTAEIRRVHVNQNSFNKSPMCETDVRSPIKQHSWIASLSAMYYIRPSFSC